MNKTGWLIYAENDAEENKSFIDWFIEEAALVDIDLQLIYREDLIAGFIDNKRVVLYQNKRIALPDFVIVRIIEPLLNLHFETLGVPTFNSAKIAEICNHKARTHHEIHKLNIPMVDTYFYKRDQLLGVPPMNYPFVLKECTGRSGKQVHYITNTSDWENAKKQLGTTDVIIQSTNVQLGNDVRVFIVGKEIIGSVLRKSTGGFRANFKLGGTAEYFPLDDEKRKLVVKIIQHFDFDMVGIDFLISKNGKFLFNEIEDVVGSRILSATTDENILRKYISHIKNKLAEN